MKFICPRLHRLKWLLATPLLYAVTGSLNAAEMQTHRYQIAIDNRLDTAKVNICFDGQPPEYLVVDYRKATKNIQQFPKVEKGFIEFQGRYWKTKYLANNTCLNYQVDISEHQRNKRFSQTEQLPISFQTENTWLWLPEKLAAHEQVEIQFQLPDDFRVSSPWQMLDEKGRRFRVGRMPHDWGFTLLVGNFQLKPVKLSSGGQLNIALFNQVEQQANLTQWVKDIGTSLGDYLGEFPHAQVQVILIENKRFAKGPVPWGDVKRGGGYGIRFVVDSEKPLSEFYADWTATHEFSHLLVPNLEYKDGWLSEGLASYLQYVLMARGRQLTPEEAWQRLYEGFNRGLKGTEQSSNEKLMQTVENRRYGNRSGRTMRIYWSGAVYFMTADVRLRKQTNGRLGLPQLLNQFNQCCMNRPNEWSGLELAKKLDQLSETSIFANLYREYADSRTFPDFSETLTQLGIAVNDGQVRLLDNEHSALRNQIIAPSQALASLASRRDE
jgi:hypothetical protein